MNKEDYKKIADTLPLTPGVYRFIDAEGEILYIAPMTLVFYGLALINASHFTYTDIKGLGFVQCLLGIISLYFIGYGLFFWSLGFGVTHIIYGVIMYRKYDK